MTKRLLYILATLIFYVACSKRPDPVKNKLPIISITPSSGTGGARVVIKGVGFAVTASANTVRFNNDSATVESAAAGSLVAIAPANGSTGTVIVRVGGDIATGRRI